MDFKNTNERFWIIIKQKCCNYYTTRHVNGCDYCPIGQLDFYLCNSNTITIEQLKQLLENERTKEWLY